MTRNEAQASGSKALAIALAVVIALCQVCATVSFATSRAVVPSNVAKVVAGGDMLAQLASGATADADAQTAALLEQLLADDGVKVVIGDYLGQVVGDVRAGSHVASIDGLSLKDAVVPYMGDFVAQMYPEVVRDHPSAALFLESAAADQVVSGLKDQLGDWPSLMSSMGIGSTELGIVRVALAPATAWVLFAVAIALGVLLAVKRHASGLATWGLIAIAVGAAALVSGLVGFTTGSGFADVVVPLSRSLMLVGCVQLVCGIVLFANGRKRAA